MRRPLQFTGRLRRGRGSERFCNLNCSHLMSLFHLQKLQILQTSTVNHPRPLPDPSLTPPRPLPDCPFLTAAAGYGSAHDQPVYWPHAGSADSPGVGSPPAGRGASSSSDAAAGTAGGNAHVPLVHTARVGVPAGPHPGNPSLFHTEAESAQS